MHGPMHQPTSHLDLTDAAISQEAHLAPDGGVLPGVPPACRRCSVTTCCRASMVPFLTHAGGTTISKKDAPCIVLPHQSDYVSHIALDIGALFCWQIIEGHFRLEGHFRSSSVVSPCCILAMAGGSLIKLIYFRMDDDEERLHAADVQSCSVHGAAGRPARGGAPAQPPHSSGPHVFHIRRHLLLQASSTL